MKSYVVYQFNCPGCNKRCIGKTDRNLCTRIEEHAGFDKDSAIFHHISLCINYSHLKSLFSYDNPSFKELEFDITTVQNYTNISDTALNWNILLFKEVLYIKQKNPELNNGLKAPKESQLFN